MGDNIKKGDKSTQKPSKRCLDQTHSYIIMIIMNHSTYGYMYLLNIQTVYMQKGYVKHGIPSQGKLVDYMQCMMREY
jgi:hypothetical protein